MHLVNCEKKNLNALCYCQLKSTHRPHKDSRRKILCCREKGSSLQNRFSPPSTQLRTSSPRSVESQNRMQVQPRRSGSVILQINLSIFLRERKGIVRATSQALGPILRRLGDQAVRLIGRVFTTAIFFVSP